MTSAAWKDLCLDALDPVVVGGFWAAALGQELERLDDGDTVVRGPNLFDIWVNRVPEPKTVKNRVHLDLYADDLGRLLDLGGKVTAEHREWTVLNDPEGNELCAFDGDPRGAPARALAVCVDSAEPVVLAEWWHVILGGEVAPAPDGPPRWLHDAAGLQGLILKAVPVSDERTVKNRCHWDVLTGDIGTLVAAGATVLRPRGGDIDWTVLADPQGNEFCAFDR